MDVKNQVQVLTPEQQQRCFFAIVATDTVQADGTQQNSQQAKVRLRDGSYEYVKNLPIINAEDPQPNGDYAVAVDNNHDPDVAKQSGAGWLYIPTDGKLHMMYILSTNASANDIRPLAEDGILQFSTEGILDKPLAQNGVYGDYWITAVAPCQTGNDAGTQSTTNKIGGIATMADEIKSEAPVAMTADQLGSLMQNSDKRIIDALRTMRNDSMEEEAQTGTLVGLVLALVQDSKTVNIQDPMVSKLIGLAAQADNDDDDNNSASDTSDDESQQSSAPAPTSAPIAQVEANKVNNRVAGHFVPGVAQPMGKQAFAQDESKKLDIWGNAVARGLYSRYKGSPDADKEISNELANLYQKNDVSFDPTTVGLPPQSIIDAIKARLEAPNGLLDKIDMQQGAQQWRVESREADASPAQGRTPGKLDPLAASNYKLKTRIVVPQTLYSYIDVPNDFLLSAGGAAGSVIANYLTTRLPNMVITAAEQALFVGGVLSDTAGTNYTGMTSCMDEIKGTDGFATELTPGTGESMLKMLKRAVVQIAPNNGLNNIYLIISKSELANLQATLAVGSGTVPVTGFLSQDDMASWLGVQGILTPEWLIDTNIPSLNTNPNVATYLKTYCGALVNLGAYVGVGSMSPTSLSQYSLKTDSNQYSARLYIGGSLTFPSSAVFVKHEQATPNPSKN